MNGCNGKMGQCITQICAQDQDIEIVAGIDMYDGIKNSKWHLMSGCRHMCFVDDHKTYCQNLKDWLASVE